MSENIPYFEPKTFVKGEKLHWKRCFADYLPSEYSLQYRFRGQTGAGFNADATADGTDFEIEVAASVTATLTAENYRWQAWLTEIADNNNTFLVESGNSLVEAGFSSGSTAAVDNRSEAKIMLDNIDAVIAGTAANNVLEYTIQGRQLKRYPPSELIELRKYYAGIVARENLDARRRAGKPLFNTSYIRVNEV